MFLLSFFPIYDLFFSCRCKNFFKRSVLVCQDRPYVCKFGNTCSVSITEVYGVKQKTSRCQACRYQACIDAGMYHSGVQRSRGGRHSYSPAKCKKNLRIRGYYPLQILDTTYDFTICSNLC